MLCKGLCAENERIELGFNTANNPASCVACEAGKTNAAGDNVQNADALQTANGVGAGDTECDPTLCAENERVVGNTCIPCEGGMTRAAGDDASGYDTDCDQDCVGSFSACTSACETASQRTWDETQAQSGDGEACPAADDSR